MFSSKKFICFLFILFSFLSCDKLRPQSNISLSEANKKFLEICQKQYNFNVTIFPLKNTLWVYLPIKSPFLTMTANEGGPIKSQEYQEKYKINFIDAVFEERQFKIFYDIPLDKIYNQDYGYNSTYAEEYQTTQRNILTAITQTYSEVEKRQDGRYYKKVIGDIDLADKNKNETHKNLVHSYVKTETVPDFFIIIIADVIRGIETKTTIAFNDLLRATIDHSFQEEYAKRTISEYPIGNKKIINDLEGKHLEIKEISWADFLAQQIVYRSRFKY
ncbi:MAG: hypothetical protein KC733_09745, partial [Candidatus Omnitrophica bacterium]|nr:hypothetical protein [Candidatus Omnitrophota bacterium]